MRHELSWSTRLDLSRLSVEEYEHRKMLISWEASK